MNELISVIVPVYNVEKWLPGCIESILNQNYHNIELILVNDESTDRSGEICNDYLAKDTRVKVMHKSNGGPSSARNLGIDTASGKYIAFIDSDDKVHNDYFSILYNIAEENKCDAVVGGYKTVPTNNYILPNFKLKTVMTGRELILSSPNVHTNFDLCFTWRYLYKLSLIKEKNIRFNEDIFIGEDVIFNLEFLLHAKRAYAIPEALYFYTVNNYSSLMKTPYKPYLESSINLQYKIRKQISLKFGLLKYKKYRKDMASHYVNNMFRMLINNLKNSDNNKRKDQLLKIINYEMFSDSLKEIGFLYRCQNYKEYMFYLALKFKIYPLIAKVYNIS